MILFDEGRRITIRDGAQAMEISTQAFLRMADCFSCNVVQFGLVTVGLKCTGQPFNGINNKVNRVDEFGRISMNGIDNSSIVKISTTSTPYL